MRISSSRHIADVGPAPLAARPNFLRWQPTARAQFHEPSTSTDQATLHPKSRATVRSFSTLNAFFVLGWIVACALTWIYVLKPMARDLSVWTSVPTRRSVEPPSRMQAPSVPVTQRRPA